MKANKRLLPWISLPAASAALLLSSSALADPGKLTELLYCMQSAEAVRQTVLSKLKTQGCLKGAYQSQATATLCAEATVYKDLEGNKDPTLAGIGPEPDLSCYTCAKDPDNSIKCTLGASVTTTFTLHLGAGYGVVKGKLDVKLSISAALDWSDEKGPVAKVKENKAGTGSDRDMNIVAGVIRPKFTYKEGTVLDVEAGVTWPAGSVEISAGYKKSCNVEMSIDTWIIPMRIGKKTCGDPPPKPDPILSEPPPCPPTAPSGPTTGTGTPVPTPTASGSGSGTGTGSGTSTVPK